MLAGKSVEGWGVNVKRTTAVAGIAYRKCMCVTAHSGRRLVQAAGPKATAPDAQLPACRGGTEEWARVRASLADLMQGRGQGWTHERSLAPYRMLGGAIGCSFCCEIVRRLLLLPLPTLPVASIVGHLWSR